LDHVDRWRDHTMRSALGELEAPGQGECVRARVAVLQPLGAQLATPRL
jgi:hypothetical protein